MNEATTPKDSPWDEELLRAVAILQLKCLMLDGQSDILSDLSDMQAHRRLNSTLSGYIVAHARSGALPPNPLGEIKTRIEKLSQVFSDITRLKKVLQDRYRFLFNNPFKSSLADIIQSQKTLEDDISQLPARLGALGAELSPLDWRDSPSTEDLLPELLLCAQGLEIDLPDEASRTEYRSLAQAKGPSYEKLQQLLQMAPGRVHALLEAHSQHREILAQVAELNASGDFVTARQLLNQRGIGENATCRFIDLDYSPASEPDQQSSLANKVREFAEALPNKCQACVQRFAQVAGTGKQNAQLQNEKEHLSNLKNIFRNWEKAILAHPGSELERECKPHLGAVNDLFGWAYAELAAKEAAGSKKRTQRIAAVIVASVSTALFLGLGIAVLWDHSVKASAEKQARQAEAAARQHEQEVAEARQHAQEAAEARQHEQQARERVLRATKESPFINSLGMKFVPVPGTDALFSVWDTRVKDYRAFADAKVGVDEEWKNPGFTQTDTHPVVNVSWEDAKAFCAWLTAKEQAGGNIPASLVYRLPTDAEWSLAVGLPEEIGKSPMEKSEKAENILRLSIRLQEEIRMKEEFRLLGEKVTIPIEKNGNERNIYPWGTEWPPPKNAGNYDPSLGIDSFDKTSPCGSFQMNQFGLYDMGGNVEQWCEDEYNSGSRWRTLRGCGWQSSGPYWLLSANRDFGEDRSNCRGFRCVLGPSR